MHRCLLVALAAVLAPVPGPAQEHSGFVRLTPDDIVWRHREEGPDVAVIAGDPDKEGFYIIRVRFAPGTSSAPHYHPNDRHVTVISGIWYTGTGADVDWSKTVALYPGSYMLHPAGAVHYDGAMEREVIVEIKGMGPAPSIPAGR